MERFNGWWAEYVCVWEQLKPPALVNPRADSEHTCSRTNNGRQVDWLHVFEKPPSTASECMVVSLSSIKNANTLAHDPDFPHSSEARLLTASDWSALAVHLALSLWTNNQIQAMRHLVCKAANGNGNGNFPSDSASSESFRPCFLPPTASCVWGGG